MNSIDMDFFNKYPRVYATATTYGFTKNEIEQMIENEIILDDYCLNDLQDKEMVQISLKMLITKLDVRKEEFREKIRELANRKTEEEIKELVGWQQVNVVYALAGLS
ncbi:hypothetical protein D1872_203970 [compost metagenome]